MKPEFALFAVAPCSHKISKIQHESQEHASALPSLGFLHLESENSTELTEGLKKPR